MQMGRCSLRYARLQQLGAGVSTHTPTGRDATLISMTAAGASFSTSSLPQNDVALTKGQWRHAHHSAATT